MPVGRYLIAIAASLVALAGCAAEDRPATGDPPVAEAAPPPPSGPSQSNELCPTSAPADAETVGFLTERSGLMTDYWVGAGLGEEAIWAAPTPPYEGRWYAGGEGMQIVWYRDALGELDLSGRQLDDPEGGSFTDTIAVGEEISDFVFPQPGCWSVTARGKNGTATFVVEVLPESEGPLPSYP